MWLGAQNRSLRDHDGVSRLSRLQSPFAPAATLLVGLTLAVAGCGGDDEPAAKASTPVNTASSEAPVTPAPQGRPGKALRAIDGETAEIEIDGKKERVHLLGLDAPNSRAGGDKTNGCGNQMSKGAVQALTDRAPDVVVAIDPAAGERDDEGNLLAYVSRGKGEATWNTQLLRAGWSKLDLPEGQTLVLDKDFRTAAASAKKAEAGVYQICAKPKK